MPEDSIRWLQRMFLPDLARDRSECWQPAVDLYETPDRWLIKCDLAGVRPQDVRVTVAGSLVKIVGERRDCHTVSTCCHHRMEIAYSHFERTVELPERLERPRAHLEFQEGMLLVWLMKEATS